MGGKGEPSPIVAETDILIFVEDPGAANYIAELPAALAKRGWRTRLLVAGHAEGYLRQRGVAVEKVEHPSATRVLASVKPRLVLVGTSENLDTLGLRLVAAARPAGIESVGVADAAGNAHYRFRGRSTDSLAYAPDWLLVPDEWTKNAYLALGYPVERTVVCGHPHHDYVRAVGARLAGEDRERLRRRLLPGATDRRKVVVFVGEISGGISPQEYQRSPEYTLTGSGLSTGRTEIVLEEFLAAVRFVSPRPYLVLRLHPKNTLDDFAAFSDQFDLINSDDLPLELIYAADVVVGMTSMLLEEAVWLGKATLSIVPRARERECLPSIRTGRTPCVTTREQLRSMLPTLLEETSQARPAADCELPPAGSLQRAVEFIEGLLRKPRTPRGPSAERDARRGPVAVN